MTGILTAGKNRWAQVYLGRITFGPGPQSGSAPTKFVLKLVDPSRFGSAMDDTEGDAESHAVDLVTSEAKAYAALEGCAFVPQYFGTYNASSRNLS